jgi:hypothetical protein
MLIQYTAQTRKRKRVWNEILEVLEAKKVFRGKRPRQSGRGCAALPARRSLATARHLEAVSPHPRTRASTRRAIDVATAPDFGL